ncbi:MAG: DUF4177 domain-containing protein [Acidobacteriota bacterium]|nr:DUF4177 domain-containing protein [Acidobacteriota bacterium]
MQKWEYRFVPAAFINEKTLNEFGAQGWELVAVSEYKVYFKRPKV